MNEDLTLRILDNVMGWNDARARQEFAWLHLMSKFKYDTYRDFVAGVRFTERLADWLQQFRPEHREIAYAFVKERLIYITPAEINHLVELTYPATIQPFLRVQVAVENGIRPYMTWATSKTQQAYDQLLKSTLFLGLSDGARIDTFRRANAGLISNEQVLLATEVGPQKWNQVLKDLRKSLGNDSARFKVLVLLDDFMGTGTTLLRLEDDEMWKGRLVRFWNSLQEPNIIESHFDPNLKLLIHHYIATEEAMRRVRDRQDAIKLEYRGWFMSIDFQCGTILSNAIRITQDTAAGFYALMETYYNEQIENEHTRKGGTTHIPMGYGDCSLPLVLEHNTPNNAVSLIWAETDSDNGQHAMRPLFRRRQRHS